MGLSSTLSNALSGMNASQRGLEVISRNVANSGTPGYHRQAVVLTETHYGQASQVRMGTVQRAFDQALQKQHVISVSDTSYHAVRASFLDRLQVEMGKPGDANSLDTLYTAFENALQALATTPDSMSNRAGALNAAQAMVERLNGLSGAIQTMRHETELQISNAVAELNRNLTSLAEINNRILDTAYDPAARLAMMDERDRVVTAISEMVDVSVSYRDNGTVALMTRGGVGLLDNQPSEFQFAIGGAVSATGEAGMLELVTPGGHRVQMNGLLSSGRIAGLLEMRDTTLVNAQNQLDEIASGLALAMSTLPSDTAVSEAAGTFTVDLSAMQRGDSFALTYMDGGVEKTVRVVASGETVTDPANLNAAGERVIQFDLSDAGNAAAALQAALGGAFSFGDDGGDGLTVAGNAATLVGVSSRITATAAQGGGLGLALFTDAGGAAFTNSLDGAGQKLGFAGRISVNQALIGNTDLLVKSTADTSLGDAARPNHLLDNLRNMRFVSENITALKDGGVRLSGRVGDLVSQTINYQGDTVARGFAQYDASTMTLDAVISRMDSAYGVDIDQEMARLMELQNAYAAGARVVSTVQELIDALLAM